MARGFLYLVVIMDWVSRAVLAWRLSNTLGAEFCVEALDEALSLPADRRSSIPTVNGSTPVPGRSDSNTDRPLGRLAPQGVSVWSDPHSDRPTVSFLGPVGRPGTPCGEALPRRCL